MQNPTVLSSRRLTCVLSYSGCNVKGCLMSETSILIPSCDKYSDLWIPFFTLFWQHWPDCPFPVYLGSNEEVFEHPKVKNILVGPDKDWTSGVRKMLSPFHNMPARFVYIGLDIAQIVYVLASSKAYQIPETLFVKTYKRFPLGHVSSVLLNVFMNHGNNGSGNPSREKNIRDHLFLLKKSMELAGIYDERYEEVLRVKYLNDIKRYSGIRGIFNEVIASLKAGII